ncbi:MAG: DUF2784 family protein [Thermoanaerobaculia bacterium]
MAGALANAVALIHAALIALVVGGALVALTPRVASRFPRWLVVAYLISVGGTLLSDLFLGDCIMTQWERTLRAQSTLAGVYKESFLQHYFGFLPSGLTQPSHFESWMGVVVAVTAWGWLQWTRSPKSSHLSHLPNRGLNKMEGPGS